MPKSYKKLQQLLTFDNLMKGLDENFKQIADQRRNNATYPLADVLKSAFAMFSLKSPSLLSFQEQTRIERKNLQQIYRIGKVPADTQMRVVLDQVEPDAVRDVFPVVVERLREAGVIKEYEYWKRHLVISIDGVEHFNSTKVHCDSCTQKKLRDGTISYSHAGLAAVLVHPENKEVLPFEFEPIVCQDGEEKNDCERAAAKRLMKAMKQRYPETEMIVVEDALYANGPHLRELRENQWQYIINVKPDSHKSLFKQFKWRGENGQVKTLEIIGEDGKRRRYSWTEGLYLCERAADIKVNCLWYEEEDRTGKITKWSWITSLPLTRRTVEQVMKAGRARWKIENETFNTLKTQGYRFEHNYGHGKKNLASVLAILMMTAFLVDQIQERCCEIFRRLRSELRTRAKLWETMRSLFKVIAFRSMRELFIRMAGLYEIKLN